HQARLMQYVNNGGTLLVQYNTRNWISDVKTDIGPYPFEITRNRVTDETAPIRFAKPDHRILNSPNKITEKDFEGWVQERGLYFASTDDPAYEKVLVMNDPGEEENGGSLLIAKHGKGYFIYTGISFFRQLPAGVPGAYRLLANLLSVNK
ncbi:MAG: PIG-L family deacetylase, partial [Bacteroidia bacterium]